MFILVNPLPLQECHINIVNWIYKYISIFKLYAQKYSIELKKKNHEYLIKIKPKNIRVLI